MKLIPWYIYLEHQNIDNTPNCKYMYILTEQLPDDELPVTDREIFL